MLIKQGKINVCGIYGIKTMQGVIKYIGGACECNDACSRHKHNLETGEYFETNKHALQELFNTEDLIFFILEECMEEDLDDLETKYINLYEDTIINREKKGKRRRSKPTTEETERRRQVNLGDKNPNKKLDLDDIIQIKEMFSNGVNKTIIAEKFNINPVHVSNIISGNRWGHVGGFNLL